MDVQNLVKDIDIAMSILRIKKYNSPLIIAIVAVGIFLFLLSVNSFAGNVEEKDSKTEQKIEVDTGIILSERISEFNKLCVRPLACWMPRISDIENLENGLMNFLSGSEEFGAREIAENLTHYKRKYFGYKKKGEEIILVNGLCSKYWRQESKNFHSLARPATDMGTCYFLVEYRLKKREFINLYIDGEG